MYMRKITQIWQPKSASEALTPTAKHLPLNDGYVTGEQLQILVVCDACVCLTITYKSKPVMA